MRALVIVLVLAWLGVVAGAFLVSGAIEGPRNVDTGFRRLDVFATWMIGALVLAVIAAIAAWQARSIGAVRLLGAVPLAVMALAVGALVVAAHMDSVPSQPQPGTPTAPTAVAE